MDTSKAKKNTKKEDNQERTFCEIREHSVQNVRVVDGKNGDLVFFTSRSSGKNVGHVGIVVTANNETGEFTFIHASLKGVKVSECEGYYERRYVGAKRIITE